MGQHYLATCEGTAFMCLVAVVAGVNAHSARIHSKETATGLQAHSCSLRRNRIRATQGGPMLQEIKSWTKGYADVLNDEISSFDHLIHEPGTSMEGFIHKLQTVKQARLKTLTAGHSTNKASSSLQQQQDICEKAPQACINFMCQCREENLNLERKLSQ